VACSVAVEGNDEFCRNLEGSGGVARRHVYYPHRLAKGANNVPIGGANWSRATRGISFKA